MTATPGGAAGCAACRSCWAARRWPTFATRPAPRQSWQTMRNAARRPEERKDGGCISVSAADGGMMAMLAMSAAALLCDHQDRIWHMYTPDAVVSRADGGVGDARGAGRMACS
jgi:hypothetical protein